ncbi:MAG: hypothetical protein ACXWE6_13180 [Nitrososphaeraceae archaeon]
MIILGLKIKIAVFWVSFSIVSMFGFILIESLGVSLPALFQSIMSTANNVFWVLFPLLMAVLTLWLKDAASRWTNVIVGIIFVISNTAYVIAFIMSKSASMIITTLFGLALIVLITIYSLRWPKNKQI